MKFIIGLALVVAVAYLAICAYLFAAQRTLIYYPVPESTTEFAQAIRIDTGGGVLKVWRVGEDSQRAILYFGGNAEDVAMSATDYGDTFPDYSVFMVNYRGYGGSTGSPTEVDLYADALALFDGLANDFQTVSVIGRSLGSGVATYVAAHRPVDRLILVTPFDSLVEVAAARFNLFPVRALIRDKFDSFGRAEKLRLPTLVLVAEQDTVIPRSHTDRLLDEMTKTPLSVTVIEAAGHNNIQDNHLFYDAMTTFMSADASDL